MEGLRSLAESAFNTSQKFRDPGQMHRFYVLEIIIESEGERRSNHDSILAPKLGQWAAAGSVVKEPSEASLKLVRIERDLDVTLNVPRHHFHALFRTMRADPMVFSLISSDQDGFHEFIGSDIGYLPTRFVGTSRFALIWTYNPKTTQTTGIFIQRLQDTFAEFGHMILPFTSYAATPYILCLVVAVDQIQRFDTEILTSELATIRTVQDRTGFGPHSGWQGWVQFNFQSGFLAFELRAYGFELCGLELN